MRAGSREVLERIFTAAVAFLEEGAEDARASGARVLLHCCKAAASRKGLFKGWVASLEGQCVPSSSHWGTRNRKRHPPVTCVCMEDADQDPLVCPTGCLAEIRHSCQVVIAAEAKQKRVQEIVDGGLQKFSESTHRLLSQKAGP